MVIAVTRADLKLIGPKFAAVELRYDRDGRRILFPLSDSIGDRCDGSKFDVQTMDRKACNYLLEASGVWQERWYAWL